MATIEAIKSHLGSMGRADFETTWPGDLNWPRERLTVFVMDCLPYGCSRHIEGLPSKWATRIERNLRRARQRDEELTKQGWTIIRYYNCEVRDRPKATARKLIQTLAELKQVDESIATAKAVVAIRDGELRFGLENWMRFCRLLTELGVRFQKQLVEEILVYGEKWSKKRFKAIWKTALHHGILKWSTSGTHPGPLYMEVMRALKLQPDRRMIMRTRYARKRVRRKTSGPHKARRMEDLGRREAV